MGLVNIIGNTLISGSGGGSEPTGTPIIAIELMTRDVYVPSGTPFNSINFSDYYYNEVQAIGDDNEIVTCTIQYSSSGYSTSPGTYNLTGTLVPPDGYSNSNNIIPEIVVHVVTLDAGFSSILSRMTTAGYTHPTPINQGDLNNLYVAIAPYLTTMDAFYVGEDDSESNTGLLNWCASNAGTITGTVTKIKYEGLKGDGSTGYINTGLNLSTLTNYTQNEAGAGGYCYNPPTTGMFAGVVASGARLVIWPADRTLNYEINGNTNPSTQDSWWAGWYHVYRVASTQANIARNGREVVIGVSDNSVARPNGNLYLLARNNGGTADFFCDGTMSCFWIGASHSTNIAAIHLAWQQYHLRVRRKNTYSSTITEFGEVINDSFARASLGNSYQIQGSASFTTDGSKLIESGGTNTNYTNRCKYKYGHSFEKWTMTRSITLASVPAAAGGTGMGIADFTGGGGERTIVGKLDLNTGGNAGKVSIYSYTGSATQLAIASTAIPTLAQNDQFNITMTKELTGGMVVFTITATRVSDNAQSTISYSDLLGDSTGDFSLFNFGATIHTTNWTVDVHDEKNHKVLFVGDSLTHGYAATSLDDRYASHVTTSFQVSGGPGDKTDQVFGFNNVLQSGKMKNILEYNTKYIALMIGGNDVGTDTIEETVLDCIINGIKNEGRRIILLTPLPRTTDVSEFTTYYATNFPNDIAIDDGFVATKNGGASTINPIYDSGDGIHLNTAGHLAAGAAISAAFPILY